MEMALLAREGQALLAARDFPAAAGAFSALLVAELDAPFAPDAAALARWTEGLEQAQREHRWNPRGTWAAAEVTVESGDSLISIRKRYLATRPEARLCTGLIERSNRLSGLLQPGQKLRIPGDPVRVLVDLEARWALYFLGDEVAAAWPVGIGRVGEETPPGQYTAIEKTEKPTWMKVGQDPIPFGDPRNPLGTRWIGWAREGSKTTYGFHGTREPESIGQAASDGCVRFHNEDVEELFKILPEGTPILVRGPG
jgi:lipoprotein-anchoring transpeptidase ErfK/SrfK